MKKKIAILIVFSVVFLVGCTGSVKGNTYSDDEISIYFKDSTNCQIYESGYTYEGTYEKTSKGYTITVVLGFWEIEYHVEVDGNYIIVTNDYNDDVEMLKKG